MEASKPEFHEYMKYSVLENMAQTVFWRLRVKDWPALATAAFYLASVNVEKDFLKLKVVNTKEQVLMRKTLAIICPHIAIRLHSLRCDGRCHLFACDVITSVFLYCIRLWQINIIFSYAVAANTNIRVKQRFCDFDLNERSKKKENAKN